MIITGNKTVYSFLIQNAPKKIKKAPTTALKTIAYLFISMQVLFKEILQLGLIVWQLLRTYVADVLQEEKQNMSVTFDCFYYLHTF